MRREGWQHGMTARTAPFLLPPQPTTVASGGGGGGDPFKLSPLPASAAAYAGFNKPTNHSKHTGKCRRPRCPVCHSHPVSKSRDKAKGARNKLRSCDVALNHLSWRVVDTGRCPNYAGISATTFLGQLAGDFWYEDDDGHREDEEEEKIGYGYESEVGCGDILANSIALMIGCRGVAAKDGILDEVVGSSGAAGEDEDEDDDMGFYEVGFAVEYLDGEDWCVVTEM